MIIVSVHLKSANTGELTELARMHISNISGSQDLLGDRGGDALHDYSGVVFRGRGRAQLDRGEIQQRGNVFSYPRERIHVWNLVSTMLRGMGHGR